MQILVRNCGKVYVVDVPSTATISELEESILSTCNVKFALDYKSSLPVSSVFAENSILNLQIPVLGGGKELGDEVKELAMKQITVKICRKCYSKNSINADRCRKKSCGHSTNLRPKKMLGKKA